MRLSEELLNFWHESFFTIWQNIISFKLIPNIKSPKYI